MTDTDTSAAYAHRVLMAFDGPCPFLVCLRTDAHEHPVCGTCGAVRYGNSNCDECKAGRPAVDAEISATFDALEVEKLRLALWSAMQRCADCITSWTQHDRPHCDRCQEAMPLVIGIAMKEATL